MAEHIASVSVRAPVHQVSEMWKHFSDYPKFLAHVKDVTYIDDERSHWVVEVVGHHEWDALNENWIPDRQVGWRSIDGLENWGTVEFEPEGPDRTRITATIVYRPPAGIVGRVGEVLGAGAAFETQLRHDLERFASLVENAPPGTLDPEETNYLFEVRRG